MLRLTAMLLALLVAAQVAWAQEAAESTESAEAAPAREYTTYVASGFNFKVDLPASGVISSPADEGWDKEPQVAFEWIGAADDPVRMIQARVDSFGKQMDEESFTMFCNALLQNWSSDEASFTVTTTNEQFRFGDYTWNLIEVTDRTNAKSGTPEDPGRTVYYSVFTTYAGDRIFTITLYYLEPVNDEVEALGVPILRSFDVTS